ncbi:TetR/AcrR family transcriptional regulator [Bradyrhizobium guangxiense]
MPTVDEGQTRRFLQKREAILDAAARLFNRRGIRGTTLSDVAQSVGLVTNSVTYYFRKKDDLALACVLRSVDVFDQLLTEAEKAKTSELRIAAFVTGFFRLLADVETGARPQFINFSEVNTLSATRADVATVYARMFRRVRGLIGTDGGHGLSRSERNARTHLLFTLTQWTRVWITRYEVTGYARAARQASDILLHGFGSAAAAWTPPVLPTLARPLAADDISPDAFLRVATRLINEEGFRGASVERISAALKVTKGAFYHHNDNKDELIVDCFARSFDVIRRAQSAADDCEDGWQRLSAAAAALVKYQLSADGPLLRITARSGLPEAAAGQTLHTMNRLSEHFSSVVVDGVADGSVRAIDPAIAAQMISGMINASASIKRWVPEATIGNVADLYARPLFMGILCSSV